MEGFVDYRYFFGDEIFGEKENPVAKSDLHGDYVKTVSDDTIKKYATEMNDKIVSINRIADGIYVQAKDKDDKQPYNYMWGDFGYYYPFEGTITYVKSERMMKHLYRKFGEDYRNEYIEFCMNIVDQMRKEYVSRNMRKPDEIIDKKALEQFADKVYIKKMEKIDNEFNKITGRTPEKPDSEMGK